MNTGKAIRKIVFISIWLVIAGGMVILLAAAMRKQNNNRCADYSITIKASKDNLFINEKDVQQLLMAATNERIRGEAMSSFNLHALEQLLEENTWINQAQLYFDNKDVLHVIVTERNPLARIFTTAGNSFYIDETLQRIPLSDKKSARVPVFTGFPEKKILNQKDSLLLNDIQTIAGFISNDSFWSAQTSQIDITPDRNFEMIPLVGNHVVKLGNGDNIDKKFHRLFVFYKEILSKTGFDKYKTIDVEYSGQVVASKQAGNSKVDSIQLRKNVEKLLQEAMEAQRDTSTTETSIQKEIIKTDSTTVSQPATQKGKKDLAIKDAQNHRKAASNPNAVKTTPLSNENKKPKAVMPRRE